MGQGKSRLVIVFHCLIGGFSKRGCDNLGIFIICLSEDCPGATSYGCGFREALWTDAVIISGTARMGILPD